MRAANLVVVGCCFAASACGQAEEGPRAPALTTDLSVQKIGQQARIASLGPSERTHEVETVDWSEHLGRCVIAEGTKAATKGGSRLEGGTWTIDIEFGGEKMNAYFSGTPSGVRIRVEGKVTQRSDRPVFTQKPGDPVEQGIPVPEGTDLDKARKRYVLKPTSTSMIRSIPDVEANLTSHVGRDISLAGTVWSLNGQWWFNHDGVDVHVAGQDAVPNWSDLHGRPMTLHGRLERRSLPRLDQIVVKPNRDLAEAFLLTIRAATPHPGWPVTECPTTR